jgi:hypothetical protein
MKFPKLDPSILSDEERRQIAESEGARAKYRAMMRSREPARGVKLDDPVLGPLKWDGAEWEGGDVAVPPFGKMRLTLANTRKTVGDAQRAAFACFRGNAKRLRAAIEAANFRYFRRALPDLVEDFGAEFVPDVKTATALWKELGPPTLHVPRQSAKSWRVVINWPCTWDEEHGHAAYIRDGRVVKVGMQGEDA